MFLEYDKFIKSLNIYAYGVINLLYLVILKRQAKILSRTQIFLLKMKYLTSHKLLFVYLLYFFGKKENPTYCFLFCLLFFFISLMFYDLNARKLKRGPSGEQFCKSINQHRPHNVILKNKKI